MKTLFIGGVKSGKSLLAERHLLLNLPRYADKPYYLATTEFLDEEMQQRVKVHQERRKDRFITIEEPMKLYAAIKKCEGTILVECVSMWINNMLHHKVPEASILKELEAVLGLPRDLVLVHNEVGSGVIPDNELARQFVDLSGKAAQLMAQRCEKVFFCSAGLMLPMK